MQRPFLAPMIIPRRRQTFLISRNLLLELHRNLNFGIRDVCDFLQFDLDIGHHVKVISILLQSSEKALDLGRTLISSSDFSVEWETLSPNPRSDKRWDSGIPGSLI